MVKLIEKKYEYSCQNCGKLFLSYPSLRRGKTHACSKPCASELRKLTQKGKNNPNFKHGVHCTDSYCNCGNTKDYRAVKCSKCTKLHKPVEGYTSDLEGVIKAVLKSKSFIEASRLCGVKRSEVSRMVSEHNLDISHFTVCKHRPSKAEDIFKVHDKRVNSKVRKYLLNNEVMEYKCIICGIDDMWNGRLLTLELDHINGVKEDNRLENLRFLCPNCHSQTSTFRGANRNATGTERS